VQQHPIWERRRRPWFAVRTRLFSTLLPKTVTDDGPDSTYNNTEITATGGTGILSSVQQPQNSDTTTTTVPSPPIVKGDDTANLDNSIVSALEEQETADNDIDTDIEKDIIHSTPVSGGNWDPNHPLKWSEHFGRRSEEYENHLQSLIRLGLGDEGYYDVSDLKIPMVTQVRTVNDARIVVDRLRNADPATFHACDTEVMDIDLKTVGPVGNGYVTCVSIYSGPDFDYGLGDPPGSVLWIDNLDDACGVLQEFKDWFEDDRHLKVWHNYGFDRHVMWNEGIDVKGFGGDTMHMARLQDTSRTRQGNGYSLEALTDELLGRRKRPMKEIFGVKRLRKDGSEGSLVDMPPVEVMQRHPLFRAKWIEYSCYDAQGTWLIRNELQKRLHKLQWYDHNGEMYDLYDYYWYHMRPFGEVLTDMERRGIRVNARDYLASVEKQAREDRDHHSQKFRQWAATKIGPDGLALNPASSVQLCTFLFGGAKNIKTREETERVRVFKVPREEIPEDALEAHRLHDEAEKKAHEAGTYSLSS